MNAGEIPISSSMLRSVPAQDWVKRDRRVIVLLSAILQDLFIS
jgi:hypothetical protein